MSTEKGPLTAEMVQKAMCGSNYSPGYNQTQWRNSTERLNRALVPILAAKCALAAAEMRERCINESDKYTKEVREGCPEAMGCAWDCFPEIAKRQRALSIPDADLRGLLECAIEAGKGYGIAWQQEDENGHDAGPEPTFESVLAEYIERSRK